MNTDEFIQRATKKFGDKFDYSNVDYVNDRTHVVIKCNTHGEFNQFPYTHLNSKYGCNKCYNSNRKILPVDVFAEKANKVHNNKFDYSKVTYKNLEDDITIICPIHGEFNQIASKHLRSKYACMECFRDTKRVTLQKFIDISTKTHNGKYDYSRVVITNLTDKVTIGCPVHGFFQQKAANHIRYRGCRKCNSTPMSTEKFIEKAILVHGHLYDYSKSIYTPGRKPRISIVCREHGEFSQLVYSHLSGTGCPVCKNSKGEIYIRRILDEHCITYIPQKRFKDCRYKRPLPFDFYISDLNLCIEYQGEQHYYPANIWGKTYKDLELQQLKDSIKRDYCKANGITLLEIKYTRTKQEIKQILESIVIDMTT